MICKECNENFETSRGLATHLMVKHKTTTKQYTIKNFYNGLEPSCKECGDDVRYVDFSFKTYCKNHSNISRKEACAKVGKFKQTWNKGKNKDTDERILKQAKGAIGEGNHFYGRKHSESTKLKWKQNKKITQEEFIERTTNRSEDFIFISTYNDYYSRSQQYLDIICKTCNKNDKKTLQALERGSSCSFCHPLNIDSKGEREVTQFIKSIISCDVVENTRKIIAPQELDIYIPEKKFAIEYNGNYWHCELNKEKDHHINKTNKCNAIGISLMHIFSDEWAYKQDIVKSMIKNRLGITENKLFARKCTVEIIDNNKANKFFDETHISGSTKSKVSFCLMHDNKIVACLSLRQPRHKMYNETLEIGRFSTELNMNVVGGFSKLLKYAIEWSKNNKYKKIMTYADLRFGKGNVYEQNGFKKIKQTVIDYWYTDGENRFDRFKFKAQDGKSERQIANDCNVTKLYGCGSLLYEMNLYN